MQLEYGTSQIAFSDVVGYSYCSTDNIVTFDHEYILPAPGEQVSSRHAVSVSGPDITSVVCILLASGGATCIHAASALVHGDLCVVAVGQYLAAVKLPRLELIWSVPIDDATCFGVHFSRSHNCIIAHGELTISRVELDGKITWQSNGFDIFTGKLTLFEQFVRVSDPHTTEYNFSLETGEIVAI